MHTTLARARSHGNRRAHGSRDDHRPRDIEPLEQRRKINAVIPERIAERRKLALSVPAPVVRKAAVATGEVRDRLLEHLHAVRLAVDENERRPRALQLVVKLAAVDAYGRHCPTMLARRFTMRRIVLCAVLALAAASAGAQSWPTKTVHIICTLGAGSAT